MCCKVSLCKLRLRWSSQGGEVDTEGTEQPDDTDLCHKMFANIAVTSVAEEVFNIRSFLEEARLLEDLDTFMLPDALGASVTFLLGSLLTETALERSPLNGICQLETQGYDMAGTDIDLSSPEVFCDLKKDGIVVVLSLAFSDQDLVVNGVATVLPQALKTESNAN